MNTQANAEPKVTPRAVKKAMPLPYMPTCVADSKLSGGYLVRLMVRGGVFELG